jgi:lactoylglutathione lyase
MANASLAFDHVHVIAKDPHAAAGWYVDKLGGELVKSAVTHGAPQIYLSFGGAMIIVRGQRPGELARDKATLEWGADHFGFQVKGDFDGFCDGLRAKGVTFSMEPTDINPATRIAFIDAPDGVSIELLSRKAPPS